MFCIIKECTTMAITKTIFVGTGFSLTAILLCFIQILFSPYPFQILQSLGCKYAAQQKRDGLVFL